jgi:hypothetical protein
MLSAVMGSGLGDLSSIPGGLWEVFMGVWLIVKGFNAPATVPQARQEPATWQYRLYRSRIEHNGNYDQQANPTTAPTTTQALNSTDAEYQTMTRTKGDKHMNTTKQTATIEGDKNMHTNRRTAIIKSDTCS